MSARIGHPSLRARISEALAKYLTDEKPCDVAAMLGRAVSTITRRAPDLREWPTDELLHLATKSPALTDALVTYLRGEPVAGDAHRVDDDLIETLASLGMTIHQAGESMRGDRHCDLDEASSLLPIVQQAQALLAKAALDLSEKIRRGAA